MVSLQWCWAREAQQHRTTDVPNWVPRDPETVWAGMEDRRKAGEENSTL